MSAKGPDDPAFDFGSTVHLRWYDVRRGCWEDTGTTSFIAGPANHVTRPGNPTGGSDRWVAVMRKDTPYGTLSASCPAPVTGPPSPAARRSRANRFPGLRIRDRIPAVSSAPPPAATDPALRSVHTSNLPALFGLLQMSLVVSTYQAGKVILIRNDEGVLNTHFRTFGKPMGIAGDRARLTIGGTNTVWYYRNLPAVAGKLAPPGKYYACYLPMRVHITGDIDIHELSWDAKDELWVVNTRFGCLCTLDRDHSFFPAGGRRSFPPSRPRTAVT
jgi:Domain of unknown function (DUF4915)